MNEKWFVVNKKVKKTNVQILINDIIHVSSTSSNVIFSRLDQFTNNNDKITLISCAAALQKNSNQSDDGTMHPPVGSQNRYFQVSYYHTSQQRFLRLKI